MTNFEIIKDIVAKSVAELKNEDTVDYPEFKTKLVDWIISTLNQAYPLSEEEINEIITHYDNV